MVSSSAVITRLADQLVRLVIRLFRRSKDGLVRLIKSDLMASYVRHFARQHRRCSTESQCRKISPIWQNQLITEWRMPGGWRSGNMSLAGIYGEVTAKPAHGRSSGTIPAEEGWRWRWTNAVQRPYGPDGAVAVCKVVTPSQIHKKVDIRLLLWAAANNADSRKD